MVSKECKFMRPPEVMVNEDQVKFVKPPEKVIYGVLKNPIYKVFMNGAHECPCGIRRLTVDEAQLIKPALLPHMGAWDIIKLDGGKIDGSGYGNVISRGEFDGGWGWVFVTSPDYKFVTPPEKVIYGVLKNPIYKVFMNGAHECPCGIRRLTVDEAVRLKPALLPHMGAWDIIKLYGGKIDGSGYGNVISRGEFDGGWGWVFATV